MKINHVFKAGVATLCVLCLLAGCVTTPPKGIDPVDLRKLNNSYRGLITGIMVNGEPHHPKNMPDKIYSLKVSVTFDGDLAERFKRVRYGGALKFSSGRKHPFLKMIRLKDDSDDGEFDLEWIPPKRTEGDHIKEVGIKTARKCLEFWYGGRQCLLEYIASSAKNSTRGSSGQ